MGAPTHEQSKEIALLVKKLQPNCLVSGRIWNDQGDFMVMGDNYQPDFKMGVPWQSPASMFPETWSYRSWQERPSAETKINEKIHDLVKVVSSGGNYLLNIGPKADGTVIPFEKQVLKGIGEWLEKNGESIYETKELPFSMQEWGFITSKLGKLYLHIVNYPENNKLTIQGLKIDINKVYPIADPALSLNSKITNNMCEIELSEKTVRDKYITVIVLEYKGELLYTPANSIELDENGEFILNSNNAETYHSYSGHDYYSSKPTVVKMKWYLLNNSEEKFEVITTLRTSEDMNGLRLSINDESYIISVKSSEINSSTNLEKYIISGIRLKSEGINTIELTSENRSNPHKGLNIDSLSIMIK
jgi:alpha-L-fucosidase